MGDACGDGGNEVFTCFLVFELARGGAAGQRVDLGLGIDEGRQQIVGDHARRRTRRRRASAARTARRAARATDTRLQRGAHTFAARRRVACLVVQAAGDALDLRHCQTLDDVDRCTLRQAAEAARHVAVCGTRQRGGDEAVCGPSRSGEADLLECKSLKVIFRLTY